MSVKYITLEIIIINLTVFVIFSLNTLFLIDGTNFYYILIL